MSKLSKKVMFIFKKILPWSTAFCSDCIWYGQVYCDGDIVVVRRPKTLIFWLLLRWKHENLSPLICQDLYRWWFLVKCSEGKPSLILCDCLFKCFNIFISYYSRRKIRLIKKQCKTSSRLNILTNKGTLRQVFMCLRPWPPIPLPLTHCIRVY